MNSCIGFRGKEIQIVLDRSFPLRGDGWMSQTKVGWGEVPRIFRVDLDEMTWSFNNRKNPFLFRDTMLKLIHSDNLEYKELTKAA